MSLWERISRYVFGYESQGDRYMQTIKRPYKNVTKESMQLAVYEFPYDDGPVAFVRYTFYDGDGKPVAVEQVSYSAEGKGLMDLDNEVLAALETGMDVTIFTRYDIRQLPGIKSLTDNFIQNI